MAYIEMRVISEIYGTRPEASLLNRSVLEKYGFTKETFTETVEALRKDYSKWHDFQKSVVAHIDSMIAERNRGVQK